MDLRVRQKLMVFHNLFFLILSAAVYFALIPPVAARLDQAQHREINLILELFQRVDTTSAKQLGDYELLYGTPEALKVPAEGQQWLEAHPSDIYGDETLGEWVYKKGDGGKYWRLRLPHSFYREIITGIRFALFAILGGVYILAVLALERFILPRYVYHPIQVLLDADAATLRGDRENEIIEEAQIPGDEVGQIMRSRNATVLDLRKREDDLETAKHNLEAQDRLVEPWPAERQRRS